MTHAAVTSLSDFGLWLPRLPSPSRIWVVPASGCCAQRGGTSMTVGQRGATHRVRRGPGPGHTGAVGKPRAGWLAQPALASQTVSLPVRDPHALGRVEVPALHRRPDLDALGERLHDPAPVLHVELVPLGCQVHRVGSRPL